LDAVGLQGSSRGIMKFVVLQASAAVQWFKPLFMLRRGFCLILRRSCVAFFFKKKSVGWFEAFILSSLKEMVGEKKDGKIHGSIPHHDLYFHGTHYNR
jgi:hypothetical protein